MKLRIWHTINFPNSPFHFDVPNVSTAAKCLKAIADYDLFLGDGEDKPFTTVGARREKREELSKGDRFLSLMFRAYDKYQLEKCPGGVPLVATNAQGLESFEDGEWGEFYNDDGDDIKAIIDEDVSSEDAP